MTKKEFFNKLSAGLKSIPNEKLGDILFDYQDYFNSLDPSISEESAVANLGNIDEIISNYLDFYTSEFKENTTTINEEYRETESIIDKKSILEETDKTSDEDSSDHKNISQEMISKSMKKQKKTKKIPSKKKKTFSFPKFKSTGIIKKIATIPLYILLIPILLILAIVAGILYLCSVGTVFLIGVASFLVSLVPFIISLSGIIFLLGRVLVNITIYNIPAFIMEFPGSVVVLLTLSFIFLGIGLMNLTIMYSKFSIKKVGAISKKIISFFFKEVDEDYEDITEV